MLPPLSSIRIVVPDHVVSREVDGMTVLLDVDSGRSFSFDEVGTRAWVALTGSTTASGAVAQLLEEYTAPAEVIERDLIALIDRLSAINLVHVERC